MNSQLDWRAFWKTYVAVLLSFVGGKLMLQTDLLMIAPLGEYAIAAFAVPNNLMVVDMIVALALGPAVSILVSQENQLSKKSDVIKLPLV